MRIWPLALLAAVGAAALAPPRARAQEPRAVDLRGPWRPRVGEKTRIVVRSSDARKDDVKRASGESLEHTQTSFVEHYDLVREVLAVEAGKVSRERLTFSDFSIAVDRNEDRSLEGQSVLVERGATGSSAWPEEKTVAPGDLARGWLERWKTLDETEPHPFLPRERVSPGGTWSIDLTRALDILGFGTAAIDSSRSHAGGRLARVEKRGIETWAVAEIKIELAITSLDKTTGPDFDRGGVYVVSEQRAICLNEGRGDAVAKQDATFDAHATRLDNGQKLDQDVSLRAAREERREMLVPGRGPGAPETPKPESPK